MKGKQRELRSVLRAAEDQALRIAHQLGAENDWQYPCAVALRAHAAEYSRRLTEYLRPQRIEHFGWCMTYQGMLCTRHLAPLEPLWQRAAFIAWQIHGELRARAPAARTPARRVSAGPAALDRRSAALRALFAG